MRYREGLDTTFGLLVEASLFRLTGWSLVFINLRFLIMWITQYSFILAAFSSPLFSVCVRYSPVGYYLILCTHIFMPFAFAHFVYLVKCYFVY